MKKPLADRFRPQSLDDIVGQRHLLAEGKPLRRIIESGEIPNLIFYGPSGVGKTTLATYIANKTNKTLRKLNGTTASTADIKEIVAQLGTFSGINGILLYLDEIQYFNKKQQQTLLEYIENGSITLIASTTENPYFYVYNAILSRSTVFEFKSVEPEEVERAVFRAARLLEEEQQITIELSESCAKKIAVGCGGDVRKAMNAVELSVTAAERDGDRRIVTEEIVSALVQRSAMRYDRDGDEHYDIVSAYQKSMRGSDPDAALHYLGRLLEAGDLPSACRRLMVCACEDVGHRAGSRLAGGAYSAGGRGDSGRHGAKVQFGRTGDRPRTRRHSPRQCGTHSATAPKQALRRRGQPQQGTALPLSARLSQPLHAAAIPARSDKGQRLLPLRRQQNRTGIQGILGLCQEENKRVRYRTKSVSHPYSIHF